MFVRIHLHVLMENGYEGYKSCCLCTNVYLVDCTKKWVGLIVVGVSVSYWHDYTMSAHAGRV